jgi:hypothetical protein
MELGLRAVRLTFMNPYTHKRVDIRAPQQAFLREYGFNSSAGGGKPGGRSPVSAR